MGGCFVQTAAGGLCSSRVSRLCALSLGEGVRQRGAEGEGKAMPLRLARTHPRLKQRGERPAHPPDPFCARPAPARPTHAMSSASAMHVHVHIPQDHHPSPVHVHLCPPDGKWKPPPSGATFATYDPPSDCTEGSAEQIVNPRRREEPGPVNGKGTDKKKVARPVGGKGMHKRKVADGRVRGKGPGKVVRKAGNGKAAGKKKAGQKKAGL